MGYLILKSMLRTYGIISLGLVIDLAREPFLLYWLREELVRTKADIVGSKILDDSSKTWIQQKFKELSWDDNAVIHISKMRVSLDINILIGTLLHISQSFNV